MAVPLARVLLISVILFLVVGISIMMRLQFSRYEQPPAVRWSAAACLVAVFVCGTVAIIYGAG